MYVHAQVGTTSPVGLVTHLKIYTEEGDSDYVQYIGIRTYTNQAWNTNSDNLWFPMPSNRKLLVELSNTLGGYIDTSVYVIGYR